jgi:hypothetical protein
MRNDDGREHPGRTERTPHQGADAGDGGGLRGGDDSSIGHGEGLGSDGLSQIGKTRGAKFSDVSNRRGQEAGETVTDDSETRLRDGDGLLSGKLETGADLSLDWCIEALKMPLKKDDENFAAIIRAKSNASNTVLTLVARVNEAELRKRVMDRMPELLKLIQAEEMGG